MQFLATLQETALALWVIESDYGHTIMLVFHALGMAAVVGVVFAFDVRVLGYAKDIPLLAFDRLLPLAWAGFAANAASGLALFIANGPRLITNWTFLLKIAFIVAGGVSVWLLWRRIRSRSADPEGIEGATNADRLIAALSIVFWIAALWAGRMIAYTLSI